MHFLLKISQNRSKIGMTGKNVCISASFGSLTRFEMYVEAECSYLKCFENFLKLGNFTTWYSSFLASIFLWKCADMPKKHPRSMWSCPTSKILCFWKRIYFDVQHMFESPSYDKNSRRYIYFCTFHFLNYFSAFKIKGSKSWNFG